MVFKPCPAGFLRFAESVEAQFRKYGEVRLVRLVAKNSNNGNGRLPAWLVTDECLNFSANAFAIVEFARVEDAARAVKVRETAARLRLRC